MSLSYTAVFQGVAETASQDEFEVQPADDKPVVINNITITQETELGDAQEEFARIDVIRGFTASGSSGGSNPTLRPLDRNNTITGGATVEINNTSKATTGTSHILAGDNWNVRTGYYLIPIPESRFSVSQADTTLVIRLNAAPADSITMDGTLYLDDAP